MSGNPYAVRPEVALPPGAQPIPAPPVPVQPADYEIAGYAENQPGYARLSPTQYGYVEPVAPPSPGPVTFFGYATAALLAIQVLLMIALAATMTWSVITYAHGPGYAEQALRVEIVKAVLGVAVWPAMLLCGLAFAAWLAAATQNARAWGTATRRSPGWAFGAWFVPVLNLWRPKQMVDDVWRGSHPSAPAGAPLHVVARPGVTLAWWATWLAAPVVAGVGISRAMVPFLEQVATAARTGAAVPPVPDVAAMQETMSMWSLWSHALTGMSAFAAAVFVVQITQWQRRRLTTEE